MSWIADLWRWYTADVVDPNEIEVVKWALVNDAVFSAFAVVLFFLARKTRLNMALAVQMFLWLLIIACLALPAYWYQASLSGPELRALLEAAATRPGHPFFPVRVRITVWVLLSITSWWILVEVWRVNFAGRYRRAG